MPLYKKQQNHAPRRKQCNAVPHKRPCVRDSAGRRRRRTCWVMWMIQDVCALKISRYASPHSEASFAAASCLPPLHLLISIDIRSPSSSSDPFVHYLAFSLHCGPRQSTAPLLNCFLLFSFDSGQFSERASGPYVSRSSQHLIAPSLHTLLGARSLCLREQPLVPTPTTCA